MSKKSYQSNGSTELILPDDQFSLTRSAKLRAGQEKNDDEIIIEKLVDKILSNSRVKIL